MINNISYGYSNLGTGRETISSGYKPIYGRVVDVILDKFHPKYKLVESTYNTSPINGILYRVLGDNRIESIQNDLLFARQGNASIKTLPLKNEIVLITLEPTFYASTDKNTRSSSVNNVVAYWSHIVSIWNHPHHNASPDSVAIQSSFTKNSKVDLGTDFKEEININPLQSFPGDTILQGRYSQSIRFTGAKFNSNPFIDSTNNGEPMIIISNGQIITKEGDSSIIEDINKDPNSIYFASNHRIKLIQSNKKQNAFKIKPVKFDQYKGNQIQINADRFVVNSKKDDILFSSNKNFAVTSNILGLDSEDYLSLDSKKIYLGVRAKNFENEPVLLGETSVQWLSSLVTQLENLATILATPGTPFDYIAKLTAFGNTMLPTLSVLKTQLELLKSKKVFTE